MAPDNHIPGFLELVPDSWLHQFIVSLPGPSKAALFACSKDLAQWVMQAAPGVTLVLEGQQELTAQQTEVRRGIITTLLSLRQSFAVRLHLAPWQPFPTQCAGRVTSLSIPYHPQGQHTTFAACCPWAAMTKLCEASMEADALQEDDVNGLCDAVQAGQLRQLRSFSCDALRIHDVQRFLGVLGPQLEKLEAEENIINGRLHLLPALQHLSVIKSHQDADLDAMMWQLCEHPTLRHLTLQQWWLYSDHSQVSCKWDTLTLTHMAWAEVLPRLPLANVKQICLPDYIICGGISDPQAVRDTLTRFAHKIVCQPCSDNDSDFTMTHPCEAVVPLLRCLKGFDTLMVEDGIKELPGFNVIWQALPACITSIQFFESKSTDWAKLWQDLPQHVTSCELTRCEGVSVADLRNLVRSAPSHLHRMELFSCEAAEKAAWLSAGLHALAPAHLHLTFGW